MRDVQTSTVHDKLVRRLVRKIDGARDRIAMIDVDVPEVAGTGVLAYGATARPAEGAVRKARAAGQNVGFIRPITIWPFPGKQIAAACKGLDRLIVPEMNLGQVNREVERYVDCEVIHFGKIGGEIHSSAEILAEIERANR